MRRSAASPPSAPSAAVVSRAGQGQKPPLPPLVGGSTAFQPDAQSASKAEAEVKVHRNGLFVESTARPRALSRSGAAGPLRASSAIPPAKQAPPPGSQRREPFHGWPGWQSCARCSPPPCATERPTNGVRAWATSRLEQIGPAAGIGKSSTQHPAALKAVEHGVTAPSIMPPPPSAARRITVSWGVWTLKIGSSPAVRSLQTAVIDHPQPQELGG